MGRDGPGRPRAGRAAAPIGKRPLHDTIARDLGVRIASGELRPGDLLSGEIEAAEQLAVSRTAYREAVRILASKGMVESRTKTGTRVSPRERWHLLDPEMLGWFLEGKPTRAFVADLFELRMMVEPQAAAIAAERRRPGDLALMADALATMERLTLRAEAGRVADRAFHQAILRATGNELILALAPSVAAAIQWTTAIKSRAPLPTRDVAAEHRAVLDAIKAGDAGQARLFMAELVERALLDMQTSLAPRPPRAGREAARTAAAG